MTNQIIIINIDSQTRQHLAIRRADNGCPLVVATSLVNKPLKLPFSLAQRWCNGQALGPKYSSSEASSIVFRFSVPYLTIYAHLSDARLANQRLRMLTEKKEALAKQYVLCDPACAHCSSRNLTLRLLRARRDIADLIAKNRLETARLRVESLIQEDISVSRASAQYTRALR